MFAQQKKNQRTKGKRVSDRYLTSKEKKAIKWYEERRNRQSGKPNEA